MQKERYRTVAWRPEAGLRPLGIIAADMMVKGEWIARAIGIQQVLLSGFRAKDTAAKGTHD